MCCAVAASNAPCPPASMPPCATRMVGTVRRRVPGLIQRLHLAYQQRTRARLISCVLTNSGGYITMIAGNDSMIAGGRRSSTRSSSRGCLASCVILQVMKPGTLPRATRASPAASISRDSQVSSPYPPPMIPKPPAAGVAHGCRQSPASDTRSNRGEQNRMPDAKPFGQSRCYRHSACSPRFPWVVAEVTVLTAAMRGLGRQCTRFRTVALRSG